MLLADLHVHSHFSDGTDSPEELAEMAVRAGLGAIALVDHDTLAGLEAFLSATRNAGVTAIPGVEISASVSGRRVHILGYHVDPQHDGFRLFLRGLSAARTDNTRRMLQKLVELGLLAYSWDEVLRRSPGKESFYSTDVFRAMRLDGIESHYEWPEWHHRYFGRQSPAYLDLGYVIPEEAVEIILATGGVPVLAHPGLIGDDSVIESLVQHGLRGIEVFYPAHDAAARKRYGEIAARFGLHQTGGSDWHGWFTEWPVRIGEAGAPMEVVEGLVRGGQA